ncbi:VOC family protein [Pseudonocardia ailaonensis]|uniref:VOC family protein n=1 Tax=Pseudonocardia ailaonensis TaxID=367279 RepID=A0ABN2MZV7_9PSEU
MRPVDPDPGFAARLRERLERLVLAGEEPVTTTLEPTAVALSTVTPYLAVRDARAVLDFYVDGLGAVRRGDPIVMPDNRIGHAEIILGGSVIMLADEYPELGLRAPESGGVSVSLRLEVADPDAVVARAVAAGATLHREVTDSPYGRGGVVVDPSGHRWMVSREAEAEPGARPGELTYASVWTPDAAAADRFYRAVLGWETEEVRDGQGRRITNTGTHLGIFGDQSPTLFCCYGVADVDAAVRLVRAAGGTAADPALEPFGRVADCVDDQGVRFAVSETGPGAPRSSTAPGDLAYVTLEFPDPTRARAFYGTVLGWGFTPGREPGHWNVRVDGGDAHPPMGLAGGRETAAVPMFAVEDIDAAVARVRAAGGTAEDPAHAGYGTAALCSDDHGARFQVVQF